MKEELTREEVLHVANLARIEVSEEEISGYQKKLGTLLKEVKKISDIDDHDSDYLIAPWINQTEYRKDTEEEMLNPKDVLKNVPRKSGNYIEVPVVISNE